MKLSKSSLSVRSLRAAGLLLFMLSAPVVADDLVNQRLDQVVRQASLPQESRIQAWWVEVPASSDPSGSRDRVSGGATGNQHSASTDPSGSSERVSGGAPGSQQSASTDPSGSERVSGGASGSQHSASTDPSGSNGRVSGGATAGQHSAATDPSGSRDLVSGGATASATSSEQPASVDPSGSNESASEDSETNESADQSASPGDDLDSPRPPQSYPRWTVEGQIQFQVNDGSLGSPRASSPFPSSSGLGLFPADTQLFVRRFRPSVDVELSPSLDLQTEYNIDPATGRIQILDVQFNYDLSEDTFLSLGRYKVPFGWEGLRSSRATNTIERSDMTNALYPERDVGMSVTHRDQDLGIFSLGTFLGQPRSNGGSNGQFDVVGRGLFNVTEDLRLGLSGHAGTYRPTGLETDLPVRRLGTELHYQNGPFKLESEAVWSNGYNSFSRVDTRAMGYYVAGMYNLTDDLQLVLHYDRFDPDLDASDPIRGRNEVNARDRKVIGINYEIDGRVIQRFMLNYEWKSELEGGHLRTGGFRARYQISW
jgi:hypothetical protein